MYAAYRRPRLHVALHVTIFMGAASEVQPDVVAFEDESLGGSVRRTEDDFLEGAPELVAEVATSSASYDLHDKMSLYERTGVSEYIVWQVYERRIDWFRLHDGRYVPMEPDARGVMESRVFPGLRLAVAKMLAGDDAGVLAELDRAGG